MNYSEEDIKKLTAQLTALETVAKQNMSKEAISRYGNLKIAHPETAVKAITIIAQLTQAGQLREKLSDEQFRDLLLELRSTKKKFRIKKQNGKS